MRFILYVNVTKIICQIQVYNIVNQRFLYILKWLIKNDDLFLTGLFFQ